MGTTADAQPPNTSHSGHTQTARYPRTGIVRLVRTVLRWWWVLFAPYVFNTLYGLVNLWLQQDNLTWENVRAQLVPKQFSELWKRSPIAALATLALVAAVTAGGILADRDFREEQRVPLPVPEPGLPLTFGPPFETLPRAEPFVGRTTDLQWVMSRLTGPKDSRVAALSGIGGIGKSALAGEAIRRLKDQGHFKDGIAVLDCENQDEPLALIREALARFDPQHRQIGIRDAPDAAALAHAARERLAGKDVLVVLDNVEPNLEAADVIRPLRDAGAAVLVTALLPLPSDAIPAIATRRLQPLPPDDALTVFANAYGGASADSLLPEERAAAERIVRVLGSHTLALTVAGRHAAFAGRDLNARAEELERYPMDLPGVERAFAQSIGQLPRDAQQLFAALAAFATADFSRNAALALARALDLTPAQSALDLLVERALVNAFALADMPSTTDRERLQLHPLLRVYAAKRFEMWSERDRTSASRAVAIYYADYARRTPARWLVSDQMNIARAIDWAHEHKERVLLAQLCLGMTDYWDSRGIALDALRYLPWGIAALAKRVPHMNNHQRRLYSATLLLYQGKAFQSVGRIGDAEPPLHQALKLYRKYSDLPGEAEALTALAQLAWTRGALAKADDYLRQALAIHQRLGMRQGEGDDLHELGQLAKETGRFDEAKGYFTEALRIHREEHGRRDEGAALLALGQVARFKGRLDDAETSFRQALAIHIEVHNLQGQGVDRYELARVASQRGLLDEAQQQAEAALALQREAQDPIEQGNCLRVLGEIAQARAHFDEARDCFARGLELVRAVPYPRGEGNLLVALGRLEQAQGDVDAARQALRDGTAILRGLGDRVGYVPGALALGELLIANDHNREEGCALIAEATAICHELGLPAEAAARDLAHKLGCDTAESARS